MANTSIRKTFSSNGNTKKWTLSWWEKKNGLGTVQRIFSCDESGNNNHDDFFQWQTDDKLVMGFYDSGYYANLTPDRKFRDTNAWYHFVFTWDTAQATASNRAKFYVNGVQETVFATETYPSQNKDSFINTTEAIEIGKRSDNDTQFLESTLSHVHFCDGYAYAASDFGSTDATTGEWKINTSPSVSYGTNGFWILKDGNTITDSSPNSNDWSSVSGTLTKTEDCPSNVFCTMNPLSSISSITFTNGNTGINYSSATEMAKGTLHFSSGKFYWEAKLTVDTNYPMLGIGSYEDYRMQSPLAQGYPGQHTNSYGAYGNGNIYANGSNTGSQSFTWSTNDIIGIAVDLDSGTKTIKWFKNGSQIATYNITAIAPFSPYDYNGGEAGAGVLYNFGNGYFGTTAVASAGTNASNIGIFEYDVPAGYTALSTKGLNL